MILRLLGTALLLAVSTFAADLWVDAGAATGGDGSTARPFRTIQQAADEARPGDTVWVRPGIYRERVVPPRGGEPGRPIRYIAEVRHGAVVKGSDVWSPVWRDEGGGLYSGELDEALFTDTAYGDGGNPYRIPYEWDKVRNQLPPHPFKSVEWTLGQVFVDGAPWWETSSRAELGQHPDTWWYDATARRLILNGGSRSLAGRKVEVTTRRGVFRPREKGLGYIELHGFIFGQWRRVTGFDRQSVSAGLTCILDRQTWTLRLIVPEAATRVVVPPTPELHRDFLGRPLAASRSAGPFAGLGAGTHVLKLPPPEASWDILAVAATIPVATAR